MELIDTLDSVLSSHTSPDDDSLKTSMALLSSFSRGGVEGFDETELVGDRSSSISSTSESASLLMIGFSTSVWKASVGISGEIVTIGGEGRGNRHFATAGRGTERLGRIRREGV